MYINITNTIALSYSSMYIMYYMFIATFINISGYKSIGQTV